jgi:hypothetical protein
LSALSSGVSAASIESVRRLVQDLFEQMEEKKSQKRMRSSMRQPSSLNDFSNSYYQQDTQGNDVMKDRKDEEDDFKIGIVCFHSQIIYFDINMDARNGEPLTLLITESDDPFIPLPASKWLYSLSFQKNYLDLILARLAEMTVSCSVPSSSSSTPPSAFFSSPFSCPTAVIKAITDSLEKGKLSSTSTGKKNNNEDRHIRSNTTKDSFVGGNVKATEGDNGGKIYLFTSSHSNVGYGRHGHRQKEFLYGTNEEYLMYSSPPVIIFDEKTMSSNVSKGNENMLSRYYNSAPSYDPVLLPSSCSFSSAPNITASVLLPPPLVSSSIAAFPSYPPVAPVSINQPTPLTLISPSSHPPASLSSSHPSLHTSHSQTGIAKTLKEDIKSASTVYSELADDCLANNIVVCTFFFEEDSASRVATSSTSSVSTTSCMSGDVTLLNNLSSVTGGNLYLLKSSMLGNIETSATSNDGKSEAKSLARFGEGRYHLFQQLKRDISSTCGMDSAWKLRTSSSLSVSSVIASFSSSFSKSSSPYDSLEEVLILNDVSVSTTVLYELEVVSDSKEEEKYHFQLAILFNDMITKQRKLRILNLTLISSAKGTIIFRNCDVEVVAASLAKMAAKKAFQTSLNSVNDYLNAYYQKLPSSSSSKGTTADRDDKDNNHSKQFIQNKLINILLHYRLLCSPSLSSSYQTASRSSLHPSVSAPVQSPKSQLVIPESCKVLPLYCLGMMKHPFLVENLPLITSTPPNSNSPYPPNTPNSTFNKGGFSPSLTRSSTGGRSMNNMSFCQQSLISSSSSIASPPTLPVPSSSSSRAEILVSVNERCYELSKILSLPIRDIINAVSPRCYNLFALIEDPLDDIGIPVVKSADSIDDTVRGYREISLDDNEAKKIVREGTDAQVSHNIDVVPPVYPPSSTAYHPYSSSVPPLGMVSIGRDRGSSNDCLSPTTIHRSASHSSSAISLFNDVNYHNRLKLTSTMSKTSFEQFESEHVYVVDDRSTIWIYIGRGVSQDLLEELFVLSSSNPYHRPEIIALNEKSGFGRKTAHFLESLYMDSTTFLPGYSEFFL